MTLCPKCGYTHEANTCITTKNAVPKPGDYTFCLNCTAILKFNDDLSMTLVTDETKIPMGVRVLAAQFRTIKEYKN